MLSRCMYILTTGVLWLLLMALVGYLVRQTIDAFGPGTAVTVLLAIFVACEVADRRRRRTRLGQGLVRLWQRVVRGNESA